MSEPLSVFAFEGDSLLAVAEDEAVSGLPAAAAARLLDEAPESGADVFEFRMPDASGPYRVVSRFAGAAWGPTPAGEPASPVRLGGADGLERVPLRSVLSLGAAASLPPEPFFRALHLARWRDDSRFCGRCGARNRDADDETARVCPACGRREYPRIAPAAIVLVEREDGALLLAHNARFKGGLYSLVAGFVEVGESLEEAAAREVREETGILIRDPRYVRSQPWPFPFSLMVGFRAVAGDGEPEPDGIEIEDARWFFPDNLPDLPMGGSVARAIIDAWIEERRIGGN